MSIGVQFPFMISTGSVGYFEVTNDTLAAIAANVRALISTNWGERPMHYQMGANLRQFAFEPRTGALRGKVSDRINQQIRQWMPFLVVDKLFVSFQEDDPAVPDNGMRIHIELLFGNNVVVVSQIVTP